MRRLLSLALILPVAAYAGSPGRHYYPAMTGELLVRYYMGPPGLREEALRASDAVNREMARGYMDGIKDSTEGVAWCFVSGKPHELNEDIAAAISRLEPVERSGNAGPLVIAALRKLFPCHGGMQR